MVLDPRLPFHSEGVTDSLAELGVLRRRLLRGLSTTMTMKTAHVIPDSDLCAPASAPINESSDATFFIVDTSTGPATIQLPDAYTFPNLTYFFKNDGENPLDVGDETIPPGRVCAIVSDGTEWQTLFCFDLEVSLLGSIGVTFDAGDGEIEVGKCADVLIPWPVILQEATILAKGTGDLVVDILRRPRGSFPPTDADSITGGNPPTLVGAASSVNTTLTGWTTALQANDALRFVVRSVNNITQAVLELTVLRPLVTD